MTLKEAFKTTEQKVAYVLKHFPKTRGSDKELIRIAWDMEGFRIPKKLLNAFYLTTNPELLTRARRRVQETGLYRASSLKTAQRSLKGIETRQYFKKGGKYA